MVEALRQVGAGGFLTHRVQLVLAQVLLMCSIFWLDGGSLIRIQSGAQHFLWDPA